MKYVYGPVKSRRLGNSLGITTVPYKVCNFDCVYCQLKKTTQKTALRKRYVPEKEIVEEIRNFLAYKPKTLHIDHITFSGSGEPTLHKSIGVLIKKIRALTQTPIVLITNSSTLLKGSVRREVLGVDLIIPSLDAVTQDVFEKIDKPLGSIRVAAIIDGLLKFKKAFKGKMWLEVMLVRGQNDSLEYLKKIKRVVDLIKPDRVQINTPVRMPSERWVKPPVCATLKKAKKIFGNTCDIV